MFKKYSSFLGIASIILLVFSGISYLAISFDRYYIVPIHLALAFLCFVGFLLSGGKSSFRKDIFKNASFKRISSYSLALFSYSGIFLSIIILLNFFAFKNEIFRFDSTKENVYSLAPQTVDVLSSLKKSVFVKAFFVDGKVEDSSILSLFKRFKLASDKVEIEIIDPEKNPILAKTFKVSENQTLVFSKDNKPSSKNIKLIKDVSEQTIVNSLIKLKEDKLKSVYYLSGHGEPSLGDASKKGYLQLKEAVRGENYALKKLILSGSSGIPKDASVLLLASPEKDYLPAEKKQIESFLKKGGRALVLGEPRLSRPLKEILQNYGIITGDDVLLEPSGDELGAEPKISKFSSHPAIQNFSQSTVLDVATSVRIDPNFKHPEELKELAFSDEKVWGEKSLDLIFGPDSRALKESGDLEGPLSVALAYEQELKNAKEPNDGLTKMIVFGDSDFVSNKNIRKLYNRDLFLNSLNFLAEKEMPVTIRSRTLQQTLSPITEVQFSLIFFVTSILLPEILVGAGFLFWWSRL